MIEPQRREVRKGKGAKMVQNAVQNDHLTHTFYANLFTAP
jgi:hypothetical protein